MGKYRIQELKRAAAVLITGCFLLAAVFPAVGEESVSASSMRLSYTEGNVKVYGGGGKESPVIKDMRLHSGYSLSTEQDSYAGILLDEDRVVKMDAFSKGELRKRGKKLELLLSEGGLLCDVEKPLEADETLNIRTATMITGIRGTVLFVKVIDQYTSMVYVMEGSVSLRGTNPNTGDERTADIMKGQKGIVTAGRERLEGQNVIVETDGFTKEEIPGYVLVAVAGDSGLADRLRAAGWDVDWMIANANRRLLEDQRAAKLGYTSVDQMYQDSGSDSNSDSGSGGDTGIKKHVVEWNDDINATEIKKLLQNHQNVVIELPTGVTNGRVRLESVDNENPTILKGQSLEFGPGINVTVLANSKFIVEGSLHISGNMEVAGGGVVENTGSIRIGRDSMTFSGSGTVESGNMVVAGSGAVNNTGSIYVGGDMTFSDSGTDTVDLSQGTVNIGNNLSVANRSSVTLDNITVGGAVTLNGISDNCTIEGGTFENGISAKNTEIIMSGGTIYAKSGVYGLDSNGKPFVLDGGTIYAEDGAKACVKFTHTEGISEIQGDILKIKKSSTQFIDGTSEGSVTLVNVERLEITLPDSENSEWNNAVAPAPVAVDGWYTMAYFSPDSSRAVMLTNMMVPELSTPSTATPSDGQLSPDIEDLLEEEEKTNNEEIPDGEGKPEGGEILDGDGKSDSGEIIDEDGLLNGGELSEGENQPSQPAKGETHDEDETLTGSEGLDEDTSTSGENLPDENEDQKDEKVFKKEEENIEGNSEGHILP